MCEQSSHDRGSSVSCVLLSSGSFLPTRHICIKKKKSQRSVGSKSLPFLLCKQCAGSTRGLFSATVAHYVLSLVKASFSLVWEAEVLWRLQPWPLTYFFFGLKLLDQLALVPPWRRISLSPVWLWLEVDSPTFLSHVPPQLGAAPFQPPCLCFPPEFSLQTFQGTFSVILGKRGHLPPLVASPLSTRASHLEGERVSSFWSLVSGTGIFRKTRDLLHWIM